MRFSIIIPAHNEEENIAKVIKALEENVFLGHEIVVVDDHSTDQTRDIVEGLTMQYKNKIRIVVNTKKPGFTNALMTGFAHAQTDYLLPVMADLCDDPDTINKMFEKIQEGYDIVCGSRYIKGGRKLGGPRLKSFFSRFAGVSLHSLIGIPTHDISNSFKMYKKEILDKIKICSQGFEISVEIPLKAYFLGYKITEIPTTWTDRKVGRSKFKVFRQGPLYGRLYLWALWKRIFLC